MLGAELDAYADAVPFGLHQIGAWLESKGHEVTLLDMMGYGKHGHDGGFEDLVAR